jgi:hypothetical protein
MLKLLFMPLKLIRFGYALAGVKGVFWLALGVGIGLLIAPQTGAELRARLRAQLAARAGSDVYPDDIDLTL